MKIELKNVTDNPVAAIAEAAAQSYEKNPEEMDHEDHVRLVKDLIEKNHMSPIEFAGATFYVEGVSRSYLAQLTRHRHASYMVSSQRYNEASDKGFVLPNSITGLDGGGGSLAGRVLNYVEKGNEIYEELREAGVPKEDARYIKPIGTTTQLEMKANFREWRHIISLRGLNDHAQWEIRRFAQKVLERLYSLAKPVFGDLMETYQEEYGGQVG